MELLGNPDPEFDPLYHVVLVEPEIPQNTGNIARLCAAAHSTLHLVRPLGFFLDDRRMRRAGLDYWDQMQLVVHDSWDALVQTYPGARFFLATTHSRRFYTSVRYRRGDFLVFGRETAGLPASLLAAHADRTIHIPMWPTARSLNLANSVAIVLYEALRQAEFPGLS